jgi:sulfite reductase (ferredoxin)
MPESSLAVTETKVQRVERLKRERNPWELFDELRRFARQEYDSIPNEWLTTYFRWWGVYTQGDGSGVVGGTGGEGKALPYFMVRIRIPNGILLSHQLRSVAQLSAQYGRGVADLTVRQNIQLHWVTIEALPDVLEALWRAGLTSMGACGDVTRNIVGCPLAGIDRDEICDASPLVYQATRMLVGNSDFYNLPRKHKVTISGCSVWCSYPEINDVGFTAVQRELNGSAEVGFALRVGGGLSTQPHLAVPLNAFVRWHQVVPVLKAITELFRDSESLRQSRERARLKFLFLQQGWTAESFQEELERRLGFFLDAAVPELPPAAVYRDHVGIHPQKQESLCYVGASVLRGRITADQLSTAADLADRFGTGELRTTNMQNLLIVNVPGWRASAVAKELEQIGLPAAGSVFARGAIACSGAEFCKLALTETKGFTRWLVEELEERVPEFDQPLKLHVTGCPNSCGQHWIADIGIEGKKLKVGGEMVDAYYFCVGGAVGQHQTLARPVGYRCAASEVPSAIERLLRGYLEGRTESENLRQFIARHDAADLRELLAGEPLAEVFRDPSPGRVPIGVAG